MDNDTVEKKRIKLLRIHLPQADNIVIAPPKSIVVEDCSNYRLPQSSAHHAISL
jgi:hypothetical protein